MSVAKSYARALFEAASESANPDLIETQLSQFASVLESFREVQVALTTPATSSKEKMAVARELAQRFGFAQLMTNFLVLLARKERVAIISEIRDAYAAVRLEAQGGMLGTVVSADPLEASELESLSKAFTNKFKKRVEFRMTTDPSLLAGMKVTVNGVTYDGSLRSQLQRLRDQLVYGSSASH